MATPPIKAGDLIGFSTPKLVSDFINVVTGGIPRWNLSHIGIVAQYKDDLVLFESTTLNAKNEHCIIAGKAVQGVQAHALEDVLQRPGRIWHYPLSRELYPHESLRLSWFLMHNVGREYDLHGAVQAGGFIPRMAAYFLKGEDLQQLFCSELSAAALSYVGVLPTSNASFYSPNGFIRRCKRNGITKPRVRKK